MFETPAQFGLPLIEDASIVEGEPDAKDKKQLVKRLLDKPRVSIARGLAYLQAVGREGRLDGYRLEVDGYRRLVKASKVAPKFLAGMQKLGWSVQKKEDAASISHGRFPEMMAAFKVLAEGCAEIQSESYGALLFARCDFNALVKDYIPTAEDLYGYFEGEYLERILRLDAFFAGLGYKPNVEIRNPFAWVVKYQGNRKVKSTPLFQVEYDERYQDQMRIAIKCASTARIAELLPRQPQFLQDDFMRRANICRGDECGWCKNHKTLGPSVVAYKQDFVTVCWYTNPDIAKVDDEAVALVEQYARMHEELMPEA